MNNTIPGNATENGWKTFERMMEHLHKNSRICGREKQHGGKMWNTWTSPWQLHQHVAQNWMLSLCLLFLKSEFSSVGSWSDNQTMLSYLIHVSKPRKTWQPPEGVMKSSLSEPRSAAIFTPKMRTVFLERSIRFFGMTVANDYHDFAGQDGKDQSDRSR